MRVSPPARAERLLTWALGPDDSARAIVGDLNEDFATIARQRGPRRAARWYWREALTLTCNPGSRGRRNACVLMWVWAPVSDDGTGKGAMASRYERVVDVSQPEGVGSDRRS